MTTHFITVEIELESSVNLADRIELLLAEQGEPLRWAIASVDVVKRMAYIEAVVTRQD